MRVVFVVPSLRCGGTEGHVLRLADGLSGEGFAVTLATLFSPGRWAGRCGVPLYDLACARPRDVRWVLRLRRHLAALRPDVVHSFCFDLDAGVLLAARLAGVPVVLGSKRSMPEGEPGRFGGVLGRLGGRLATRVVCCSDAAADAWAALEGLPRGRYVTVYTGVDLSRFSPARSPDERAAARRRLGLPDAPTCVCVANLSANKGHELLLRAFSIVSGEVPHARLLLVGRDDMAGRLQRLAEGMGLSGGVVFLGERDDVADLLRCCDVGVLASATEGLPNAVIEYMATALPVVSTDVGGVAEAVRDGVTGLLVAPDDPAAMAGALGRLLRDGEAARAMGLAGRRLAEERFDAAASVASHARLYRDLRGGAG